MDLFSPSYYVQTRIAAVFGAILSLFGIGWIIVFTSYLTSDPRTIELFSIKSAIDSNGTVTIEADKAKGFLITSLVLHFLWFQASAALLFANKWGYVSVLWVWIILSLLITFADFLGTAFSVGSLFMVLSEKKIDIQVLAFYAKLFVFFSKLGFAFHYILIYFVYVVHRRKNQMVEQSGSKKSLGTRSMVPISTIQSHLDRYNAVTYEEMSERSASDYITPQPEYGHSMYSYGYNESVHSGYDSSASTAIYLEPTVNIGKSNNNQRSSSATSTLEWSPQSTSSNIQVTEL